MTTCCVSDDHLTRTVSPIRRRQPVDSMSAPRLAAAKDEAVWAEVLNPPSVSHQPVASVRFRLRSMFLFIAGLSLFFSILARLGIDPGSLILGLFIFSGVALFGMFCIEAYWELTRTRRQIRNNATTIRSCDGPLPPGYG